MKIDKNISKHKKYIRNSNKRLRRLIKICRSESMLNRIYYESLRIHRVYKTNKARGLITLSSDEFKKTVRAINNKAKRLGVNRRWRSN